MKRVVLLILVASPLVAMAAGETPDARNYSGPAWSPYLVGAGIGLLVCLTMFFSKKPVGASSSYATAAGLIGKAIAPRHTARLKYYQDNPPRVDWELLFVSAAIVGAFLAAWHGNELTQRWLPPMWVDRFGEGTLWLRALVALLGGLFMSFGARMAGGCTSGHGISGAAQLNVASWIALVCFFIGGVIVANILFRA
jgi:uncharacterized membrane protein YedE/YeeE